MKKSVNDPSEKIIQVTKVTPRHQTTIPVAILKFLGINPEGAVVWVLKNGEVIVRKQ